MKLTDDMIAEMREDLAKANDGGMPVYDDVAIEIALGEIAELRAKLKKYGAVECSFCGKAQSDVAKLIAGPSCYICNECVALCATLIPLGELIRPLIGNSKEVSLTVDEMVKFIAKLNTDQPAREDSEPTASNRTEREDST